MSVSISLKGKTTDNEARTLNVSQNAILQTVTDEQLFNMGNALCALFIDPQAKLHKIVETVIR